MRNQEAVEQARRQVASLQKIMAGFTACLAVFFASLGLAANTAWITPLGVLATYLACGAVLDRLAMRRLVRMLLVADVIHEVAGSRLSAFMLWPMAYGCLFFRVAGFVPR